MTATILCVRLTELSAVTPDTLDAFLSGIGCQIDSQRNPITRWVTCPLSVNPSAFIAALAIVGIDANYATSQHQCDYNWRD